MGKVVNNSGGESLPFNIDTGSPDFWIMDGLAEEKEYYTGL